MTASILLFYQFIDNFFKIMIVLTLLSLRKYHELWRILSLFQPNKYYVSVYQLNWKYAGLATTQSADDVTIILFIIIKQIY